MINAEEKIVFDWMDHLDPNELIELDDIESSGMETLDEAAWSRIKKRTFSQLNDHEKGKEKRVNESILTVNRQARHCYERARRICINHKVRRINHRSRSI